MQELKDLIETDIDNIKLAEAKKLLFRLRSFAKVYVSEQSENEQFESDDMPHLGVSIVGKQLVKFKFNLENKKGKIDSTESFGQDINNNHVAAYTALNLLKKLAREQK